MLGENSYSVVVFPLKPMFSSFLSLFTLLFYFSGILIVTWCVDFYLIFFQPNNSSFGTILFDLHWLAHLACCRVFPWLISLQWLLWISCRITVRVRTLLHVLALCIYTCLSSLLLSVKAIKRGRALTLEHLFSSYDVSILSILSRAPSLAFHGMLRYPVLRVSRWTKFVAALVDTVSRFLDVLTFSRKARSVSLAKTLTCIGAYHAPGITNYGPLLSHMLCWSASRAYVYSASVQPPFYAPSQSGLKFNLLVLK